MQDFILLSVVWFAIGYVGSRLLARKGYNLDGFNAIREDMFLHTSVSELNSNAKANIAPASMALLSVGGVITLLVALLIRPKKLHYTG